MERMNLMEIRLTPAAVKELGRFTFGEDEGVRVEAVFTGRCTIAEEHSLKIDRQREGDDRLIVEDIPLLVSKESRETLHESITLDFSPKLGFKLSSPNEVYRYNLVLEKEARSGEQEK